MSHTIPFVTVSLMSGPLSGKAQLIVRLRDDDKGYIDRAAALIGVSQADFTRMVLVNAAKGIINEINDQAEAFEAQKRIDEATAKGEI